MVQLEGQQREHSCPPRIVVRESLVGGLERLHALGVDRTGLAPPSPAVGEHRASEAVGVVEISGELRGVEQRLAKLAVPDLALGPPQADQQLTALGAMGTGRLVVELERLAIPARGLVGGELPERALCRSPSVVNGLGGVGAHDRRCPMAGKLTETLTGLIPALLLQCHRDPFVQAGAASTPEILI